MNRLNERAMTQQEEGAIDAYLKYEESVSMVYQNVLKFVNNHSGRGYDKLSKVTGKIATLINTIYNIDKSINSYAFEQVRLVDQMLEVCDQEKRISINFQIKENEKVLTENKLLVKETKSKLDGLYSEYLNEERVLSESYDNDEQVGASTKDFKNAIKDFVNYRNGFELALGTLSKQVDKKLNSIEVLFNIEASILQLIPILGSIEQTSRLDNTGIHVQQCAFTFAEKAI